MFSTPKCRKWANKSFVISVLLLRLSPLMHCGDVFWLAGRHPVLYLPVSFTNAASTTFISMPVIRIQLVFYVGVSEIIDKLIDSIWRLRQLWVHCYSVLCSLSLATFSRHYRPVYNGLVIHGGKCHARWWATQLQYLSVINLTGTTHKL